MRINIVYGSPASGKSTFVKKNKSDFDIVFDYDAICAAYCFSEIHENKEFAQRLVIKTRTMFFNFVAANVDNEDIEAAWIITSHLSEAVLRLIKDTNAQVYHINTPKEECIRRAQKDETRRGQHERSIAMIEKYFAEEQTDRYCYAKPKTAITVKE